MHFDLFTEHYNVKLMCSLLLGVLMASTTFAMSQ